MKKLLSLIVLVLPVAFLCSCVSSNVGSATKQEKLKMKIKEERNIITTEKLKKQNVPTLDQRASGEEVNARGLVSFVTTGLVSLATDAVKKVIANEKKKYIANYEFGLTDLYFYDQLSNEGAFDPVGLQFSGFKLTRTFINSNGILDTALVANFYLDTLNSAEMINNSIFRLRLKDFQLNYAKAKIAANAEKKLNMDIEIIFITSYVNSDGILFDGIVLGKFYLFLRNAPLDKKIADYDNYYNSLKDSLLIGKSFIIPRSYGYHREPDGIIKSGYSQGAYTIQVKVKESAKDRFVNKLITDNANLVLEATSKELKAEIKKIK